MDVIDADNTQAVTSDLTSRKAAYPTDMSLREAPRADRSEVTGIRSFRRADGTYRMSPGVYGPNTLIKEMAHFTLCCPVCESVGRREPEKFGFIVCENPECGYVISENPVMVRENYEGGESHGMADVDTNGTAPAEPDVQ